MVSKKTKDELKTIATIGTVGALALTDNPVKEFAKKQLDAVKGWFVKKDE